MGKKKKKYPEEGTMAMQDDNIVHETIPRAACVYECVCEGGVSCVKINKNTKIYSPT